MSKTREKLSYTARRREVAKLYLEGWRQIDLAEKFSVTQPTISNDIAAIQKEWLATAVTDHDTRQTEELAKLGNLERKYWELHANGSTAAKGRSLEGIRRIIEIRCKLLGLNAPTKLDVTWRDKLTAEQKAVADDFFAQVAASLAAQMTKTDNEAARED